MKNLFEAEAQAEIRQRMAALTPADTRAWGTLTVEEMMAHVRGAYIGTTSGGEAPMEPAPIPRGLLKFAALSLPMQWPKTVQTVQGLRKENMPPADSFQVEYERLVASFERFLTFDKNTARHAIFGAMKPADWMRWGYLHADHHLRQFGR